MNREFQQSDRNYRKEPSENPVVKMLLRYFILIKSFYFEWVKTKT